MSHQHGSHKKHDKKKTAMKKDKSKMRSSKSKSSLDQAKEFPGAIPGAETHASALWLGSEVDFNLVRSVTPHLILLRYFPCIDVLTVFCYTYLHSSEVSFVQCLKAHSRLKIYLSNACHVQATKKKIFQEKKNVFGLQSKTQHVTLSQYVLYPVALHISYNLAAIFTQACFSCRASSEM